MSTSCVEVSDLCVVIPEDSSARSACISIVASPRCCVKDTTREHRRSCHATMFDNARIQADVGKEEMGISLLGDQIGCDLDEISSS